MYLDFSSLFHRSSKDRSGKGRVRIPLDEKEWPETWSTVEFKDYPRTKKIVLAVGDPEGDFWKTVGSRKSSRDFDRRPLKKDDISNLLKYSCGSISGKGGRRAQPSGGGRYPIESYPTVFAAGEVASGVYHYDVQNHSLDQLWERDFSEPEVGAFFTYPWASKTSMAIFLTAVFERNQRKYGERGYRQIMIEAGAIVQNLYLVSAALGLKCCAIDGVREPAIEKLIDVDGITESVVTTVLIG